MFSSIGAFAGIVKIGEGGRGGGDKMLREETTGGWTVARRFPEGEDQIDGIVKGSLTLGGVVRGISEIFIGQPEKKEEMTKGRAKPVKGKATTMLVIGQTLKFIEIVAGDLF